ncbi:MAG: phosphatase PAP2 family protein [Spirochaetales bacterium]|nr:phosphatase PAP2 family protein [Spirochaetales bacterium]
MQENILLFFQDLSSPLLDKAAEGITMLGEQYFYIAVIAFVFWNVSKKSGLTLAFSYLISALINTAVKLLVRAPRPFESLASIEGKRLHTATGYSFPSGHTQGAAAFFTAGAFLIRKTWFTVLAAVLVVLVAVSRVYLGVHWPVDVLFGLLFGVIIAWGIFVLVDRLFENRRLFLKILGILVGCLGVVTVIMLILDAVGSFEGIKINDYFKLAGTTLGALGGFLLEEKLAPFSTGGKALRKALRYILGVATTVAVMTGLKPLFPETDVFDCLRYLLTGLWLTFLFPWVGMKIKLFEREKP